MFRKLKKKFILINMTLLTTTFMLIFGSIYIFTYINSERELRIELKNTMHSQKK